MSPNKWLVLAVLALLMEAADSQESPTGDREDGDDMKGTTGSPTEGGEDGRNIAKITESPTGGREDGDDMKEATESPIEGRDDGDDMGEATESPIEGRDDGDDMEVAGYTYLEGDCQGHDITQLSGSRQTCGSQCNITVGCVGYAYVISTGSDFPRPPCFLKNKMCQTTVNQPGLDATSYFKSTHQEATESSIESRDDGDDIKGMIGGPNEGEEDGHNIAGADLCGGVECQNGGTCINSHQSYACKCRIGYTGKQCENDTILLLLSIGGSVALLCVFIACVWFPRHHKVDNMKDDHQPSNGPADD